jgi:broad specificity phosphatase PhoE
MTTRIFLIRHGRTIWNKRNRYCGCSDVSISREGRGQAEKLRGCLKDIPFDKIYCSAKRRATQTCRVIFNGAKFTRVPALREINFGALEGMYYKDIMRKYRAVYENWIRDPYKHHIPKSEPVHVFKKRVEAAINKIVHDNAGKTVAIVCHGGVIGIFVSGILKSRSFWNHVPSAASITVVEYKKGRPRIKLFNDTAHLK